jgi:membrane protease YdiL (CAAX protease family)
VTITESIRRPLTWFFVLANAPSCAAWAPSILSENGLGLLHFRFPELLGASQLSGVLPGAYLGPIFSAYVVTAVSDGRPGLRQWVGRLANWRVNWRWYVGVVVAVPAVLTVSTIALSERNPMLPAVATLVAYVPGLVLQMITTGLAEEPGWRDFALPRLQSRFGPLGGGMTKTRPALWVLLVISAVCNVVTSASGQNVLIGIGFGLLTLAFGAALVVDHYRSRRS